MLDKRNEFKFIRNILKDKVGNVKCFFWKELVGYTYVGVCSHYSNAHLLADEYYLRGISFIDDTDAEIACTGACNFSCMSLGFLLSNETSNDPIRYVSSEYHQREEKDKMSKLVSSILKEDADTCRRA